jgi:cytochrome P450
MNRDSTRVAASARIRRPCTAETGRSSAGYARSVPERPPAATSNPVSILWRDVRSDRAAEVPFPPGELGFSLKRTARFDRDPLGVLLESYERYGPIFTIKVFHHNAVFMLGPEANHYMLVANAKNFLWRSGHMRDLIPLMGDGLLTIDGAFHRTHRKLMLPAFHRERIEAASAIMQEEIDLGLEQLRPGEVVDVYHWTRRVALRVALRALFGVDPDTARAGSANAADEFESALSFYGRVYLLQILRGPGTPFARMKRARRRLDRLIYGEIDRRRSSGERGEDILSMLLDARDEDGRELDREQIRDEVMTLLFAGHDTTTSTVTFLFYELARNPELLDDPDVSVEMIVDETLRKYPPAYIGPRQAVETFEFNGFTVPAGAHVHYCSWASHHLPEVFPEPERFVPQRFSEENKEKLPPGAYVPFGGGSRTCIGMRFGLAEVALITRSILDRYRLRLQPGYELEIRHAPTISPRQGLPMVCVAAA